MKGLLKELCLINGVSGDETAVRESIIEKIKDVCEYRVDNLGSIICFKKGRRTPEKKLMICAHMDEVGFIITYIRSDGTLSFGAVGGIDPSVIIGRQVMVKSSITGETIYGVVGTTAVHNLSKEQREKAPKTDSLYIDIGAADKAEAEKTVALGDNAYFVSEFTELGETKVKCKAIDDRAGCAMMIEMLHEELEYDTYFVFNVQEEIGLRGSTASAFAVAPDYAIVLEATTAADIDGASGAKRVCELGKGPVVSFMDRSTMYDKELYRLAFSIAAEENIPCQTKTMVAGGNDAGAIHVSGKGVRTIAVSVPCRYLHSPSCVIDMADLDDSLRLVRKLAKRITEI
ncbi:MAG TPA: M42 family metallopeptidase [Ruminococcus sp.]|nr:M42 family metallopeptidase [Ruminococcus sp.]